MSAYQETLELKSTAHDAMIDITSRVEVAVYNSGIKDGLVTVYCPHTTAAITINENADPDVVEDMLHKLNRLCPWREDFYSHSEGNSAAHVKSSLLGVSQTIPLADGRMTLGTWQGIYFCEFDGPRKRKFVVKITG